MAIRASGTRPRTNSRRGLAASVAALADDGRRLADMYCQAAYAPGTLRRAECLAIVTRVAKPGGDSADRHGGSNDQVTEFDRVRAVASG